MHTGFINKTGVFILLLLLEAFSLLLAPNYISSTQRKNSHANSSNSYFFSGRETHLFVFYDQYVVISDKYRSSIQAKFVIVAKNDNIFWNTFS